MFFLADLGNSHDRFGFAMLKANAGFAAYSVGICGLLCFGVGVIAIFYGHKEITRDDKISSFLAFLSILLLIINKDPLYAILLTATSDMLSYYATFRKAYGEPENESMVAFALYALTNVLMLLAVEVFSFTSALYPAAMLTANIGLLVFVLIRRRQLKRVN